MRLQMNPPDYVLEHTEEITLEQEEQLLLGIVREGEMLLFSLLENNLRFQKDEDREWIRERTVLRSQEWPVARYQTDSDILWVRAENGADLQKLIGFDFLFNACVVPAGATDIGDAVLSVDQMEPIDGFAYVFAEHVPGVFAQRALPILRTFPNVGIQADWEARWKPGVREVRAQLLDVDMSYDEERRRFPRLVIGARQELVVYREWDERFGYRIGSDLYVDAGGILHDLQPLAGGRWAALVGEEIQVLSPEWEVLQRFDVGEEAYRIQVAKDGNIWVEYYGEDEDSEPMDGAVCFNEEGGVLFRLNDHVEEPVVDCAMNVADDSVWFYARPGLALYQVRDGQVVRTVTDSPANEYASPMTYSNSMAVRGEDLIFEAEGGLYRVSLADAAVERLDIRDETGQTLVVENVYTRGAEVYVLTRDRLLYHVDVAKKSP